MASIQGLLPAFNGEAPAYNQLANRTDPLSFLSAPAVSQNSGDSVSLSQSAVLQQYSREYRNQQSVSLDLLTREGDRVTVQLSSLFQDGLESVRGSASFQGLAGRGALSFSSSERTVSLREQVYFSVEGDLNDAEKAAIESLLVDLDDLLEDFFAGDVEQALNEALAIELDGSEIAALSLEANQSTITREIKTYQSVQQLGDQTSANSAAQEPVFERVSIDQLLAVLEEKTRELLEKFQQEAELAIDKTLTESAQTLLTPFLEVQ